MTGAMYSRRLATVALTTFFAVTVTGVNAQTPGTATKATMTAKLVDPEKKAADHAATVEVTMSGVELIDPAVAKEKAVPGQGHLHYQVDNGPVVATPTPKLSFHELAPGAHTISVVLAGNDHKPLGPHVSLTVTVPKPATAAAKPSTSSPAPKSGY